MEMLNNLPKITQPVNDKTGIQTQFHGKVHAFTHCALLCLSTKCSMHSNQTELPSAASDVLWNVKCARTELLASETTFIEPHLITLPRLVPDLVSMLHGI